MLCLVAVKLTKYNSGLLLLPIRRRILAGPFPTKLGEKPAKAGQCGLEGQGFQSPAGKDFFGNNC